MREFSRNILWDRKLAVFLTLAVILGVIGPFGTYIDLGLSVRLIYWCVQVFSVGFILTVFVTVAVALPQIASVARSLRIVAGSILGALPATSAVIFIDGVIRPPFMSGGDTLLYVWAQVAMMGTIASLVEYWNEPTPQEAEEAQPVRTKFHRRLPADIGDDIVSFSMRDHYVEVTTTAGQTLVLMRMVDAMDELEGLDGYRLHRSHWAAADHITGLTRKSGKYIVTLDDGRELPVSKTYRDAIAARWPEK